MRRSWIYGIVFVAVAAVASAVIFWPLTESESKLPACRDKNQDEPAEAEEIFFKPTRMGSAFGMGKNKLAGLIDFHEYESEEGVELSRLFFPYQTKEAADEEMQARVRKATQVIERGPLFDADGKPTGERAVLLMPGKEKGKSEGAVAWTKGKNLWVVESPSLRHAQAYYDQNYGHPEKPRLKDMHRTTLFHQETNLEKAVQAYVGCYQYEDGIVVKRTIAEYPSAAQAHSEKQRIMNYAVRMLNRIPSDAPGIPWVVLRMPPSRPREARMVVLWEHGATLVINESSSVRHAWDLGDARSDPWARRDR